MGKVQVRYISRVVNYDRRGFIRLATGAFVRLPISSVSHSAVRPQEEKFKVYANSISFYEIFTTRSSANFSS